MMGTDRLYKEIFYRLQMTDGRRSQVVLLDERRLEILIQPKLYAGELLDIVASHFGLKEKEYFGLAYIDETGHHHWLHLDQRVLDHEFSRKSSATPLVLHFLVKFFVEGISQLRDSVTVELFYLQAKSLIFKEQVEVESDVVFQLAAQSLQATHGDHISDATTKSHLKKHPLLPSSVLKDQPSIGWCEDKVIGHYKKLAGQSRGFAIVNYMSIVEGLPTYGVHYYDVKDKGGSKWWLGLSYKGIAQYEYLNQKIPKKVFQWRHLENLYFRDRKFSIEVHDQKRITHALSSFNLYEDAIEEPVDNFDELSDAICDPTTQVSVSRRTFGPGNVTVLVWFASSPVLTKAIWSMAISQHQFYLDRKQSKTAANSIRRLSEIAAELSTSRQSLSTTSSASNLSRSGSAQSLNTTTVNGMVEDAEQSEAVRVARQEMFAALKARKDALEEKLKEKNNELKLLCIKEAEIIGVLPPETPLAPGEPKPQIRRRMGTAFTLPEILLNKLKSKEEEDLASLELEYEIQKRISSAALKLANDSSMKRSTRKQRKINYQQSETKLKDIEQKLLMARSMIQKSHPRGQIKKKQPRPSLGDLGENVKNRSVDDVDSVFAAETVNLSAVTSPVQPGTPSSGRSSKLDDTERHNQMRVPPSPRLERHHRNASQSSASSTSTSASRTPSTPTSSTRSSAVVSGLPATSPNRPVVSGYIPSSIYQTRSTYRNQQYPTLSTRTHRCHSEYDNVSNSSSTSSGTFSPLYKNKYDASHLVDTRGLYNVPMQRTSQAFYSQDELEDVGAGSGSVSSGGSGGGLSGYNTAPSYGRRHHSVSNPTQRYGSLDRKFLVPHARMESSRSLDNLDNPDDGVANEMRDVEAAVMDRSNTVMTVETRFSGVLESHPQDYPVSPPSPYDEPYQLDENVDTLHPFPSAMQSHLPVGVKSDVVYHGYRIPPVEVQDTVGTCADYLPPTGQPVRSQSHQLLHLTLQRPVQQQLYYHKRSLPLSASHQVLCYTDRGHFDGHPSVLNSGSPLSYQQKLYRYEHQAPAAMQPNLPPEQHSVNCLTTTVSPKAKEKEWYETSLDSPLSPRRASSLSDQVLPPKSPLPLIACPAVSPQSPMRSCSRNSSLLSPQSENNVIGGGGRFAASTSPSFDRDQSVFLPMPFESSQNCTVVSIGQFQPYREETKPYEMSDYYKYSTKVRKQQQQQQNRADNHQPSTLKHSNSVTGQDLYNSHNVVQCAPSPRPTRLVKPDEVDHFANGNFAYPVPSSGTHPMPFLSPRKLHNGNLPPTSPRTPTQQQQQSFHQQSRTSPSFPSSGLLPPDEVYGGQQQGIYSPPRPMTCDPIGHGHSTQGTPISSPTTIRNNSLIKSRDNSFTLENGTSLADAFHDEMLAWYEGQESAKEATLV